MINWCIPMRVWGFCPPYRAYLLYGNEYIHEFIILNHDSINKNTVWLILLQITDIPTGLQTELTFFINLSLI